MNRLHRDEESFTSTPPLSRFSQNFLADDGVARRIVETFAAQPAEHVLEVGPGDGQLTKYLVGTVARLIAVEIDRRRAERLASLGTLEVRQGDILAIDLLGLAAGQPLRIIANLPYSISSPFVVKLATQPEAIVDALLLLQLEFADRIAAEPGTKAYGSITVAVQSVFDVTPLFRVPPTAFRPRPKVQSRLVRLTPRADGPLLPVAARDHLRRLLRAGFSGRRKTLANALSAGLDADRARIAAKLEAVGIDPRARAETLSPSQWADLATGPFAAD